VDVQVNVYNQQGQMVRSLVNDTMGPGEFQVTWDGRDDNGVEVATGVYLYRIEAPNLSLHKKVTFIK
jgi:flagellar hook assembly protein FlgD